MGAWAGDRLSAYQEWQLRRWIREAMCMSPERVMAAIPENNPVRVWWGSMSDPGRRRIVREAWARAGDDPDPLTLDREGDLPGSGSVQHSLF